METQRNEITVKINATMEEVHKIIKEKEYEEIIKQITFKIKNIDSKGNILSQKSINCEIESIEDTKNYYKQ